MSLKGHEPTTTWRSCLEHASQTWDRVPRMNDSLSPHQAKLLNKGLRKDESELVFQTLDPACRLSEPPLPYLVKLTSRWLCKSGIPRLAWQAKYRQLTKPPGADAGHSFSCLSIHLRFGNFLRLLIGLFRKYSPSLSGRCLETARFPTDRTVQSPPSWS